jgi:hypothetical protein
MGIVRMERIVSPLAEASSRAEGNLSTQKEKKRAHDSIDVVPVVLLPI